MSSEFDGEIAVIREDVEAELADLLTQLPAARSAADAAKRRHESADFRFHDLQLRVSRATGGGKIDAMGATLRLLNEERGRRDSAAAAMVRAKKHLENVEYTIGCKRAELDQLSLVERPPALVHKFEVVKRSGPQVADDYDTIVMPARAS